MYTGYQKLQEIAPPASAAPKTSQQIKITTGDSLFVVTYVEASRGWCIYYREPGQSTAKLRGKPMRTLADAFASVAEML